MVNQRREPRRPARSEISFAELGRLRSGDEIDHQAAPAPGDVALEGVFLNETGHGGMRLHATDASARADFETETMLQPALTVGLYLDGAVEARFDDRPIRVGDGGAPSGVIWNLARPVRLSRRVERGVRVRKVQVSLGPEWFRAEGGAFDTTATRRLRERHLEIGAWTPSPRAIRNAEEILRPDRTGDASGLRRLAHETRALEIVYEAFRFLEAQPPEPAAARLRDVERARRARDFIEANLAETLCLGSVARATGMSVSTLQRVFKASFGVTVVEHLRRRRLEQAREALIGRGISVAEAAALAGYTGATGFATAFQREFGYPPSRSGG